MTREIIMNTVKLNMGMYRKIKTYDYTEIYKNNHTTSTKCQYKIADSKPK